MADKEKKVGPESKVNKATTEESKAAEKVAKAAKGNNKKDKPNFFVRASKGSKKFFKDFKGECKKIDWPDAQTILKSTGIVLVVVAIVSVFVFALDFGLKEGIEQLKYLASGETKADSSMTDGNIVADEHDHEHEEEAEDETEAETEKEAEETTKAEAETEAKAEETTAEKAE